MTKQPRIYSIDVLKGICMVYMIVDHLRDQLSRMGQEFLGANNPLPIHASLLEHVETASFWLRCTGGYFFAPSFLFLAGASCYLWQSRRGPEASLFHYLFFRGIMLALLNCALFFHMPFSQGGSFTLHVLWPMGLGMILLGAINTWPKPLLWSISIVCIAGQNFFESISFTSPFWNILWELAFKEASIPLPWGASLYNLWPLMPWFGMLLLGYLNGSIFTQGRQAASTWAKLGLCCLISFLILRLSGVYGDPSIWQVHTTLLKTVGALIAVSKYPPSLQFTLYGLGITFLFLAAIERFEWRHPMLLIFGSTPLFFYVVHLICIRASKFIILHLPASIIHPIQTYIFSLEGLIFGTTLITLFLWFLCNQYKTLMKFYAKKKQRSLQQASS